MNSDIYNLIFNEKIEEYENSQIVLDDYFMILSLKNSLFKNLELFDDEDFNEEHLYYSNYKSFEYLLKIYKKGNLKIENIDKIWKFLILHSISVNLSQKKYQEHNDGVTDHKFQKMKLLCEYNLFPENKNLYSLIPLENVPVYLPLKFIKLFYNYDFIFDEWIYNNVKDPLSSVCIKKFLSRKYPGVFKEITFEKFLSKEIILDFPENKKLTKKDYKNNVCCNDYYNLKFIYYYSDTQKIISMYKKICLKNSKKHSVDNVIISPFIQSSELKILFNDLSIKDFTELFFLKFNKKNLVKYDEKLDYMFLIDLYYNTMKEIYGDSFIVDNKKEVLNNLQSFIMVLENANNNKIKDLKLPEKINLLTFLENKN